MERIPPLIPVLIVASGALVAFLIGHYLFYWRPPHTGAKLVDGRANSVARAIRSYLPCLIGAFVGRAWAVQLNDAAGVGQLIGAWIGAQTALYLVVLVSVPTHAATIVNAQAFSELERTLERKGHRPIFIWPMDMVVRKFGSVTWFVHGQAGSTVVISFRGTVPFEQRRFDSTIREDGISIITAGPVVESGPFKYHVSITAPGNRSVEIDPMIDVPKVC